MKLELKEFKALFLVVAFACGLIGMHAYLRENPFHFLQRVVQIISIFLNYKSPNSMSIDSIFASLLINLGNGAILTMWGYFHAT